MKKSSLFLLISILTISLLTIHVRAQNSTDVANQTTISSKRRFLVPVRELNEFVYVRDLGNGEYNFSGFSIDVFSSTIKIAFPSLEYDIVPYANPDGTMKGTFDEMLQEVENEEFDGAVGEITILPSRMQLVDFTLPYLDTEIGILVRREIMATQNRQNVSLTPVTKIILLLVCVLGSNILVAVGFWIWRLFKYNYASSMTQPSSGTSLALIMHIRLLMTLVLMVILLILASYMPPQTSASRPTQPEDDDIKSLDDLKRKGSKVGYRQGAFVKNYLINKGGLSESQLVELRTEVDILDKLRKGTEEGGVDALVAGTHHLVLLKDKNCANFTIIKDLRFKSAGLGFAFRKNLSPPLVNKFSEAIVTLIDNGGMAEIQDKTIGSLKDKDCIDEHKTVGSTFQDRISLWLPAASATFVVVLVILMFLSYCGSLCIRK